MRPPVKGNTIGPPAPDARRNRLGGRNARVQGRRSAAAVLAIGSVALVGSTVAATGAPRLRSAPKHHRALSARRIARDSKRTSGRVIVLLRNQHRALLATAAGTRARAAIQARERAPMVRQIRRSGGRVTRQFRTLNAFAATVSKAEGARLAKDPKVAKIVPDAVVSVPRTAQLKAAPSTGPPAPSTGPGTAPQSQTCPSDPQKPLLEPEALQTHARRRSTTRRSRRPQNLATGKGVKVAFFADGIDINNPDFIRADGSHVFIDYRDFTGEGPNAPTGAPRRSATRARSRRRAARSTTCRLRQPGAPAAPGLQHHASAAWRPGASLIGMKVFGEERRVHLGDHPGRSTGPSRTTTPTSSASPSAAIAIPDTAADVIKPFNDAAVAAGITVSQGTGDAGAHASPSRPGRRPARDRRRRRTRTSAPTRRRRPTASSSPNGSG